MRDITLGETIDYKFTTTDADGAPATLSGTPAISAYVGNSTTQITAGITLSVDFDGVTGLNNVRVVATSGNGYTTATDVALVITTGTVDSVSVVGYKVAEFSIGRPSTANVTQFGGSAGVFASGVPGVNTTHINGTAQTGRDIGASVLLSSGTGTGQVTLTSGRVNADITHINTSSAAAIRLALSAGQIIPFTVDTAAFSPTNTAFETSTITEATADHFKDRIVIWTTGALTGQQQGITASALVSGRERFTLTAGTEAAGNGDTGIIV